MTSKVQISKAEKEKTKLVQDKCQEILADLLRDDDNKYCVDCDAKGPRWASWNLGVFLCIRCAGIHRNLGVHISKVKSINLDSWTPEQVGSIQQMGNSKARAVYEANLPDGHRRPQTDSALEAFIRAKYEQRKYIAREWVPPPLIPAFDIEEEVKKDKDKRRQTNKVTTTGIRGPTASSNSSDQNNSVPRPVSTHPSSTTISADKVPKDSLATSLSGSKSNNDLLGINFGDSTFPSTETNPSLQGKSGSVSDSDLFAAFDGKSGQVNSVKDEEDDFFNQKAPDMTKKLDTNSILKLYESSNPSTNFFNPIATMTPQPTSLNQQLPFGMQINNSVQTQQSFGTFNRPLVPGLIQQPVASSGFPDAAPVNSETSSAFGAAGAVTNPFLASNPIAPTSQMGGFGVTQPAGGVPQISQQLGSLQMDSKLINNWLGTNLSTSSAKAPQLSVAPPAADLFSGLTGGFNKSQNLFKEPVLPVPVTSVNPFLTQIAPATATNDTFIENNFASFPASSLDSTVAPSASSFTSQSQSDFGNLNWANFSQTPAIPTGGPSVPTSSVLPSTDLWQ